MPQEIKDLVNVFKIVLIIVSIAVSSVYLLLYRIPKSYPQTKKFILALIIGFIWIVPVFIYGLGLDLAGRSPTIINYTLGLPIALSGLIRYKIEGEATSMSLLYLFFGSVILASVFVYLIIIAVSKIMHK